MCLLESQVGVICYIFNRPPRRFRSQRLNLSQFHLAAKKAEHRKRTDLSSLRTERFNLQREGAGSLQEGSVSEERLALGRSQQKVNGKLRKVFECTGRNKSVSYSSQTQPNKR